MYNIKQAAKLSGVPEGSLRAWERRYAVVTPHRSDSGYRVYDDDAVAAVTTMRRMIEAGWAPGEAARAVRERRVPASFAMIGTGIQRDFSPTENAAVYMERFLAAAAAMDPAAIEVTLDRVFALGSFEHVVDSWLMPTLEALGEGWMRGEIDVAGEHMASHAVLRRLAAAFEAAARSLRGPRVVVGLPEGSHHELGALAFAVALRRRGLDTLYLGANVPRKSWLAAVRQHDAQAAVMAVVTADVREAAAGTALELLASRPDLVVATGGSHGHRLAAGTSSLPELVGDAADHLDALLHGEPVQQSA
jgi:DNA-binding transcriptional MerR regulator/methylmalonyl-CoA mutase cobalamin-binding subunit